MQVTESHIRQLIEEKISGTDIFIVEVNVGSNTIQISLDKPAGITIGECAEVGRYLNKMLEESAILETHDMEVSSPGMSEPLKVLQQYQRRIGREVEVRLIDGTEKKGKLKLVNEDKIEIEIEKKDKKAVETVLEEIPFSQIKETKLVISFK